MGDCYAVMPGEGKQDLSRVTNRPAGRVRRFSTFRGSSQVGSRDVRSPMGRAGSGPVGPQGFHISRVGSGHPDPIHPTHEILAACLLREDVSMEHSPAS